MATLGTIRTYVKANIGLATTAEVALIDEWANDAVREVLQRTHCHVNCLDLTLTASTWKYDLPVSIMAVKEVYRDSDGEPLVRVTPEELIDLRRSSLQSGEDTTRIRYAVLGHNLFAIWPTPTTTVQLDVWYVPMPTEMSDTSHDPSTATYGKIPKGVHTRALETFVLAKAAEYTNDKPSGMGQMYWAQFEQQVRQGIAAQNRLGGRLPRARVGQRPSRAFIANDVYPRSV